MTIRGSECTKLIRVSDTSGYLSQNEDPCNILLDNTYYKKIKRHGYLNWEELSDSLLGQSGNDMLGDPKLRYLQTIITSTSPVASGLVLVRRELIHSELGPRRRDRSPKIEGGPGVKAPSAQRSSEASTEAPPDRRGVLDGTAAAGECICGESEVRFGGREMRAVANVMVKERLDGEC